ncbi:MAG: phosphoribosyltransferase [Chitinophagaceae bacterium]|jgi:pyrimidine operon attenuation protein/uracil phosphoribosyltransferase|nr:phosphoribosyltransferase [Chitinophagaceae bacterium]
MNNYILTKEEAKEKLHRMALEIAENLSEEYTPLILIGINKNGVIIAEKIKEYLLGYVQFNINIIPASITGETLLDAVLDTTEDFNNKNIIVIDDVSNSGKTLLYAIKPLLHYQPKRIQTLVVVERMHKLFPIKPDYVGLSLATTATDFINVEINDDEIVGAYVMNV